MKTYFMTDKKCPVCEKYLRQHTGLFQKYLCKNCNEYFYEVDLIERKK